MARDTDDQATDHIDLMRDLDLDDLERLERELAESDSSSRQADQRPGGSEVKTAK